jgi:hypothetical protein
MLLEFIERSPVGVESRCILTGVAFAGAYCCVNTRQLKSLLGRSKSSINGGFQQLGYVSVKARAAECIEAILPWLTKDVNAFRQWTVRCATGNSPFCFLAKAPVPALAAAPARAPPPAPPPAEPERDLVTDLLAGNEDAFSDLDAGAPHVRDLTQWML